MKHEEDSPGLALLMKALPPAHAGNYCNEEHQPHCTPETTWLMGHHAEGLERILWRPLDALLEVADEAVTAARALGKTPLQIMAASMDALFALDCPGARAAMEGDPGADQLPPASPGDPFSSGSTAAAAKETWGTRVVTHDRYYGGDEILERTPLDHGARQWAEKVTDDRHLVMGSCTRSYDNADFAVTETGGRGILPVLAGTAPDLSARAVVQMDGRLQCVTLAGKPGCCSGITGKEALRVEGMSLVRIVAHIAAAPTGDEKKGERAVCITALGAAAGTLMAKLFPGRFGGSTGAAASFANQEPIEIRIGSPNGGTVTRLTVILSGSIALAGGPRRRPGIHPVAG